MTAKEVFTIQIKNLPHRKAKDCLLLVSKKLYDKYRKETGINRPRKFKGVRLIIVKGV